MPHKTINEAPPTDASLGHVMSHQDRALMYFTIATLMNTGQRMTNAAYLYNTQLALKGKSAHADVILRFFSGIVEVQIAGNSNTATQKSIMDLADACFGTVNMYASELTLLMSLANTHDQNATLSGLFKVMELECAANVGLHQRKQSKI